MRFVSALLLLLSLMTTHAAALERAAEKSGQVVAEIVSVTGIDHRDGVQRALAGPSFETHHSAAPTKPCLQQGDCHFLVPTHSFAGAGILAAYGKAFPAHGDPISGRLIDRPPIG